MNNLRITEINYHPLNEGDTENNDGEYEFIELKNVGNEKLDLSGMSFSRGLTYSFPNGSEIGSGEFLVLASNKTAFFERYGFQAFDEYEGQLDNSGETLALNTVSGDTLIKIHYNDKYPWPNSADGEGYSIVTRETNPFKDQNDAQNWRASAEINGNPGRDDDFVSTVDEPGNLTVPQNYQLLQNYPNPFNASTIIEFQMPQKAFITINLYNILGRKVDELVSGYFEPGFHSVNWNASRFASGIYFYKLTSSNGISMVKKLVYVR